MNRHNLKLIGLFTETEAKNKKFPKKEYQVSEQDKNLLLPQKKNK